MGKNIATMSHHSGDGLRLEQDCLPSNKQVF